MTELRVRRRGALSLDRVHEGNPLPVSVENGDPLPVASRMVIIPPVTIPGIGVASAYAANDQMGTAFAFNAPSKGIIREVKFHDLDYEGLDKEIWLFSANPTLAADNAAFSIADADNANCIAVFTVASWHDAVNNYIGFSFNTPAAYNLNGKTTIYGAVKTKGADNIAVGAIPLVSFVIETYA